MNILMFNYEYPPLGGGGGVVHALVAEELARRHRVCLVTSGWKGLPRREVRNGVEIHRVPVLGRSEGAVASLASMLSYPPAAWLHGGRWMRRERFDVVNAHFAVPSGPGSLPLAKLHGVPHIVTIYGGDIYDPSKRLSPHRLAGVRQVVAAVLRHSDAVVADSTNIRDHARRFYAFSGPVEIIPLAVHRPVVTPATRADLDLPSGFLAVTVGRLVRRKAVDRLLHILSRPELQAVHLVVVGEGPESESLRRLAASLGIQDRVVFAGRVDETRKWQILRCADAYLSATMHEGFGLVYLEAMGAGLPVVTTDDGGQTDFLRDEVNGYLVPAGDDDAFARAIRRLLDHPATLPRMRDSNLQAFEHFSLERCSRAYERLFDRILGTASRGPTAIHETTEAAAAV